MRSLVLAAAGLMLAGCQNKIQSTLTYNGAAFHPTSCRNGAAVGFFGVEFSDASGSRLRLESMASGGTVAHYFAAGAAVPIEFGVCGTIAINTQNSTVNNVRNVEGNATLNCTAGGSSLQGSIQFQNCH